MAPRQPLPNISEDDLIDLAGGATVLLAKELVAKGKVKKAVWSAPVVEALVDDGTESREASLEPALGDLPAQRVRLRGLGRTA